MPASLATSLRPSELGLRPASTRLRAAANKRKAGLLGVSALGMYYLLPKTAESIVNFGYQLLHEDPPKPQTETKQQHPASDHVN